MQRRLQVQITLSPLVQTCQKKNNNNNYPSTGLAYHNHIYKRSKSMIFPKWKLFTLMVINAIPYWNPCYQFGLEASPI